MAACRAPIGALDADRRNWFRLAAFGGACPAVGFRHPKRLLLTQAKFFRFKKLKTQKKNKLDDRTTPPYGRSITISSISLFGDSFSSQEKKKCQQSDKIRVSCD